VYVFSLAGIIGELLNLQPPHRTLAVLFLILAIHSAGFRFLVSRFINPEWSFLLEGGLAGQRVLGQVFQPSAFGVFLMLAIFLYIHKRTYLALAAVALAATFHPTYLLSGAILTSAFMAAELIDKKPLLRVLGMGVFTAALVLPILAYVFSGFATTPPEMAGQARDILVNYRIPHHARVSDWLNASAYLQLGLVCATLLSLRGTKLFPVVLVSSLMVAALTALQVITTSDFLALLLPWRLSVVLVPLSVTYLLARLLSPAMDWIERQGDKAQKASVYFCLSGISLLMILGSVRFEIELSEKGTSPENAVMAYVRQNKSPQDVYLVPVKLQDFRLASGAPIFVDFKAIPYRDREVLEWYRRVHLAEKFYRVKKERCETLELIRQSSQITHAVIERGETIPSCGEWQMVYADDFYQIAKLNE